MRTFHYRSNAFRSSEVKALYPCNPICAPANLRNDITNAMMSNAHITITKLYEVLKDMPMSWHAPHDCTHLNEVGNMMVHALWLRDLDGLLVASEG